MLQSSLFCLLKSLNANLQGHKVMDDDIVSDDKMGKSKIKLEKLGLTGEPMVIEEKVYNRVFGKDSYVHLKLSYTE